MRALRRGEGRRKVGGKVGSCYGSLRLGNQEGEENRWNPLGLRMWEEGGRGLPEALILMDIDRADSRLLLHTGAWMDGSLACPASLPFSRRFQGGWAFRQRPAQDSGRVPSLGQVFLASL